MTFSLLTLDGRRVAKIDIDPPHYLDSKDLLEWMEEVRDDNPDLYAELVHIYFMLRKPTKENPMKLIARIRKYLCQRCGAEFLIPLVRDGKECCPNCGCPL